MGAWGTGLYANDLAEDARTDFNDVFSVKSVEEATKIIIEEYTKDIADDDWEELADFWYAFADWQWNKGILQPKVKQAALNLLNRGAGLELWIEEGRQSDIKKRKETLENLRRKLDSPMPPKKKIRNSNIHFRIEPGDIIAVRPNERFIGYIKENGIRREIPFFTAEYIKFELRELYEKRDKDAKGAKGYEITFKEGYQPVIERESYYLLLCVKKERYYNERWNIKELYDESVEFIYYDYYSRKLPASETELKEKCFFEFIEPDSREKILGLTDWFSGYVLEKYKKLFHSEVELEKFKAVGAECKGSRYGHPSNFLLSYELLRNPLIDCKLVEN